MLAVAGRPEPNLDFDTRAVDYARHRKTHPGVVHALADSGLFHPQMRALDVGCGTGNYAAALTQGINCRISGVDPSARMLELAREAAPWDSLVQGTAESLPFADHVFDVVMSTDVIHHIKDRDAYYREAARVLRPGGHIVTVTDSHEDIPRRRPLSSYFPETIEIELRRYPPVPQLMTEMAQAGFSESRLAHVDFAYDLEELQPYRDRAFSSLLFVDDEAFRQGISRMEADLARGPIPCLSLYSIIWGTLPGTSRPVQ